METNTLSGDVPQSDPNQDRLGYAPFAAHLAGSIARMTPPDGLVMAVYGPWGSGKSTLLNFVAYSLTGLPESERPLVVRFNPWWFSGHEDLTHIFLDQLRAALGHHPRFDKIRTQIANFADAVAEVPLPVLKTGKIIAKMVRPPEKNVPALKTEISQALRDADVKILVIVDDIDRLTAEEIRQLFRCIKAVADFPNIIYLLAFDRQVVVEAVRQGPGVTGEAYLEKIVQVSFELPLPDSTALGKMLYDSLNLIIASSPDDLFDNSHWLRLYMDGLRHFIRTPRDVVRLTNTLQVTFPAVISEVNLSDFIAIESLRVFCPTVYDVIRRNPEQFYGHADRERYSNEKKELQAFHEEWLAGVPIHDREAIKSLVIQLFPKLLWFWGNTIYGWESEVEWRRTRRIASRDVFPVFFRLALPEGDLSYSEMQALLAATTDAVALRIQLLALHERKRTDGSSQVLRALERLQDYTRDQIPDQAIPVIFNVLLDIGDMITFNDHEGKGFFMGVDMQIGRILYQLSQRLTEPVRFDYLRDAFLNGSALATMVHRTIVFGQEHGKFGSSGKEPEYVRTLTEAHLTELEQLVSSRIQSSALEGTLPQNKHLVMLLTYWHEWGDAAEARAWTEAFIVKDENLLDFLSWHLSRVESQAMGDYTVHVTQSLDPERLRPLIDPDSILPRVQSLALKSDLPEKQQISVIQFLKEYKEQHSEKE